MPTSSGASMRISSNPLLPDLKVERMKYDNCCFAPISSRREGSTSPTTAPATGVTKFSATERSVAAALGSSVRKIALMATNRLGLGEVIFAPESK